MKLILQPNNLKKAEQVLIVILDGVGYTPCGAENGNAIAAAKLPTLNKLWDHYPTIQVNAHGKAVGMPSDDDMGNSEVGHNVLGCGRVFDQGAKLVSNSIQSGEIFRGKVWLSIVENCKKNKSTLHLIGLLSDGNVHSHINHLRALVEESKKSGISRVRIHALLDGRDVPQTSALEYISPFEEFLGSLNDKLFDSKIASGGGRMLVTMDRYEADWSIVERGWRLQVEGTGRSFVSATEAVETMRKEDPKITDQYLPGFVIADDKGPVGKIQDGDSVIFFNFRGDRAIEISKAFTEKGFDKFKKNSSPSVYYAGMMQYDGDLKLPENYLVLPPAIDRTMGEYFADNGVTQYALSETQKFGHVTFFWNGNRSDYFDRNLETYVEIHSDILPFDQAPKMKAGEITDSLIEAIKSRRYKFLRVNYANGDMVGHTGNFQATVTSLEFLDECIARVLKVCDETNTVLLITADHGNADEMYQLDKAGNVLKLKGQPVPKTSHTLNPVNLTLYDHAGRFELKKDLTNPGLANIPATIIEMLGFLPPEGYEQSLLIHR